MLKINVITQLIVFMCLAIVINQLHIKILLALLVIFIIFLIFKRHHQFINALKRFRWLFVVLMIIYTFNTPGEHIQGWPFYINPTYEGIVAGLTQAVRISLIQVFILYCYHSRILDYKQIDLPHDYGSLCTMLNCSMRLKIKSH
jgi:energy-coupling factor transporter transmembrane protein EcfT